MRSLFLFIPALIISSAAMAQTHDFTQGSLLFADTLGVKYYLDDLSLWEGPVPDVVEQAGLEKDRIRCIFLFSMSEEYVISRTDFGEELWHSTSTKNYGCVVQSGKILQLYTGEIGREYSHEEPAGYRQTFRAPSPEGPLQKHISVQRLSELLGHDFQQVSR